MLAYALEVFTRQQRKYSVGLDTKRLDFLRQLWQSSIRRVQLKDLLREQLLLYRAVKNVVIRTNENQLDIHL
jgi:hypothetical protein